MARLLITGARGFIGRHLARELAAAGHAVHGLGHGIWPAREAQAWGVSHWLNGDITPGNLRLLQKTLGTPEAVFHLAGGSSVGAAVDNPREDFFRTVATTAELLDWLRLDAPHTRLLVVSSAAVYGAGHEGRIAEDTPARPCSPYGAHKWMMEELCRSHAASCGLHATVARLFSVYGPGLRKQLLWDLCSRLAHGGAEITLGGSGRELRDWTDVRDVARALRGLLGTPSPAVPVFNVGTGVGTPVHGIATRMAALWAGAAGTPAVRLAFSGQSRPGDPFSLVADARRLQAQGFEWRMALDQGLADVVAWFRAQPQDRP